MGTARGLRAVVLGNLAGLTRQRGSRVSTREIWNRRRRGSAGHDGRGRGIFAALRLFHRTRRLTPVRPLVTPGISRSRRLRCGKARGRAGQKTGRIVPRLRRFRNAKRRGPRAYLLRRRDDHAGHRASRAPPRATYCGPLRRRLTPKHARARSTPPRSRQLWATKKSCCSLPSLEIRRTKTVTADR